MVSKKGLEPIEKEFQEIRKLLSNGESKYTAPYIQRQIHENVNLRKVFLAVIKHSPALIHEIHEDSILSKQTCYNQLFKLIDLKLIDRAYYIDIVRGKVKNDKEILEKFEDLTSKMNPKLKRYYESKCSFWRINDYGKTFAKIAYKFNEEFREKEVKNDR